MTNHPWRHWFWVTPPCKVLFLLAASQVAAFPPDMASSPSPANISVPSESPERSLDVLSSPSTATDAAVTPLNSLLPSSSSHLPGPSSEDLPVTPTSAYSADRKLRVLAASSEEPNGLMDPGPRFTSDVDDTYNGENSDVIDPAVKKYHTKYTDHKLGKKYKNKSTSEKVINIVEEEYDISIKRILTSSTVAPPPADRGLTLEPPQNTSEAAFNDEPAPAPAEEATAAATTLDDDVSAAVVSNVTENYAEDVEIADSKVMSDEEDKMAVAAATSVDHQIVSSSGLDAASITGITLAIVVFFGLFGATSFVLYRRRYLNKPQVLNDKSSTLDSSGYIDDTSLRVGIPLPMADCMRYKENSEEMYSLDNDSFLNSLEAMTIQNYWTENVKHTKL